MAVALLIRKNQYIDSILLMRLTDQLDRQPEVEKAAALIATEKNKRMLTKLGVDAPKLMNAGPTDLAIALVGENQTALQNILDNIDTYIESSRGTAVKTKENRVPDLESALDIMPKANLAVISIPGEYAAREAKRALEQSLNVFLFSGGVSVDEERHLKQFADKRGLLLMGPDCGTAILGGAGVGFANKVRSGSIGVVGSSGTGLQEFTSLVHVGGGGISQAIGTGSRDMTNEIGGISTGRGLDLLVHDSDTEVICVISKPPGEQTLRNVVKRLREISKPTIGCFLGLPNDRLTENGSLRLARTVDQAAHLALVTAGLPGLDTDDDLSNLWHKLRSMELAREQKYLRGLYAGGTFCFQAQQVMGEEGLQVFSNVPIPGMSQLKNPNRSRGHTIIDMGDEYFTTGRPHPMIDPGLRQERIREEAEDPNIAVLLLDFVLGWNASLDPVGDLSDAIHNAQEVVSKRGGTLPVIASVTGTDDDPQSRRRQIEQLEELGVLVTLNSADAARLVAQFVKMIT